MKRLGINLDPIVSLRAMGGGRAPDPLHVIAMLEMAGVDSIVYSIQNSGLDEQRDLRLLKEAIHSHFNLRMTLSIENAQAAIAAKAEMVTLIHRDNGVSKPVNLIDTESLAAPVVSLLRTNGIVVSALLETDANQIKTAARIGCDYAELDTVKFTHAPSLTMMEQELENMKAMAMAAKKLTLGVTLAGDINYSNVRELLTIEEVEEINVGHSIITRALFVGFDQAVRDFTSIIKE